MQNRELSKKQIIVVSLISLLFLASAIGADLLMKADAARQDRQATPSEAVSETKSSYQYARLSSKLTDLSQEAPYEPGPSVLNLAYYYPEGADTSDVIHSYAGQLYTKLTELEAEYMSSLYNLGDQAPLSLATQLGIERNRVLGKFNPQDTAQSPDQPDSWVINRFKNVNISFYDGDNNRINGYSTVKEIMSMASVYCYYHDMMDYASMEQYALALWAKSHSDQVSMGNVYYDTGCLAKSIEEEAREALALEQQQELTESELAGQTALSAGDAVLGSEEENAAEKALTESNAAQQGQQETVAGSQTQAAAGTAETNPQTSGAVNRVPQSEGTQNQNVQNTGAVTREAAAQKQGTETNSLASSETAESTNPPVLSGFSARTAEGPGALTAQTAQANQEESPTSTAAVQSESQIGEVQTGTAETANEQNSTSANAQTTADDTTAAIPTIAPRAIGPAEDLASGTEPQGAFSAGSGNAADAAQNTMNSSQAVSAENAAQTAAESESTAQDPSLCPGHIDLYVTVKLQGIDDTYGLFAADPTGNREDTYNDRWTGWTPERMAEARALNAQDWFTQYGLTISAINVRDPLTEIEIQDYMNLLPEGISQTRRDIIEFALHSVGKIPYYWGGKPYAARYERNGFGTLIQPDTKGRVLRGLDCSGWINWVYWSVQGQRLAGESTATLIGCGRRISRSDLQPGDIMVRTGPDAHVVMFLAWAANGRMIVVHESAGTTNNVTVSEISSDWPYYRALAD